MELGSGGLEGELGRLSTPSLRGALSLVVLPLSCVPVLCPCPSIITGGSSKILHSSVSSYLHLYRVHFNPRQNYTLNVGDSFREMLWTLARMGGLSRKGRTEHNHICETASKNRGWDFVRLAEETTKRTMAGHISAQARKRSLIMRVELNETF